MSRTLLHENPYFTVVLHKDGPQDWYRVEAPDAAMIVGRTEEGAFLFVSGSRGGRDALRGYEFPGGLVAPSEDPADAAIRELEEETGYRASDLSPLGWFYTIAAVSSSRCFVFEATVAPTGHQKLERGEDWTPVVLDASALQDLMAESAIRDASTLAALALHTARSRV